MNSERKLNLYFNLEEEYQTMYFDNISMLAVDKCLRLHKEHKEGHSDHGDAQFVDARNKHVEACLNKIFALHGVFDDEYLQNIK